MEESTEKRKAGRPKGSVKKSPQNSPGHPKMGGHKAYYPPMEEWAAACEFIGSKRAMARFLGMSPEWLHNFLNKEAAKADSDYLRVMKKKKQEFQELTVKSFKASLTQYDPENGITPPPACLIFAMKSIGGFDDNPISSRIKQEELELKKQQLEFEKEKFKALLEQNAIKLTASLDEETLNKMTGGRLSPTEVKKE